MTPLRCTDCGYEWQEFDDERKTLTCPACGKELDTQQASEARKKDWL